MQLDHISYATSQEQISSVVNRIGSQLRTTFVDGGIHPKFGTRNFTAPLRNSQYIEIVCPLDHPATETTPFGKAVKKKVELGGGWLTWVISTDNLDKVEEKYERKAVDGLRTKPDGSKLKWKQIGVSSIFHKPELPYYIKWESKNHPSQDGVPNAEIDKITLSGESFEIARWPGVKELIDKNKLIFTNTNLGGDNVQLGIITVEFLSRDGAVKIN